MPRVRALLVGLEGMTGDIVGRLLKAEPECQVVEGTFRREDLLHAIREHEPSVVVLGLTSADVGPEWDDLFRLYPKLPVLAVTPDGHRACLFREPLVKSLVAALKASAETGDAR